MHASSEPIAQPPENPNDISIFDAETQFGNEPETSDNVNDNVHDNGMGALGSMYILTGASPTVFVFGPAESCRPLSDLLAL